MRKAGGVAGIVAAFWVAHMMTALPLPSSGPLQADFRPDFRILALTMAVSLAAGIACGLAPALASVRSDIGLALKEGGLAGVPYGSRGYRRFSLRNLFVVAQVAASLMLLLVTGFIVTGYGNVSRIDPGFDTNNLDMFSIDPIRDGYSTGEAETLFARLPEQLSRTRGVRAVALAGNAPFGSLLVHTPHARLSASTRDGGRPGWCRSGERRVGEQGR